MFYLQESFSNNISDEDIRKIFDKCVSTLNSIGYLIDDDIKVEEVENWDNFGMFLYPKYEGGDCVIQLNKNGYYDKEECENTIYHELAHYLVYKQLYKNGDLMWTGYNKLSIKRSCNYKPHGEQWRKICDRISAKTHLKFSASTEKELINPNGTTQYDSAKYVFECPCGNTLYYQRKTDFVKAFD